MRAVVAIAAAVLTALLAMVAVAFVSGSFQDEARLLLDSLWGRILFVDLYGGLALFAGWVLFRETEIVKAIIWILLIFILHNIAAAVYVLYSAWASGGDWKVFWLGDRLPTIVTGFSDSLLRSSEESPAEE